MYDILEIASTIWKLEETSHHPILEIVEIVESFKRVLQGIHAFGLHHVPGGTQYWVDGLFERLLCDLKGVLKFGSDYVLGESLRACILQHMNQLLLVVYRGLPSPSL